jgi:hypothetical protein
LHCAQNRFAERAEEECAQVDDSKYSGVLYGLGDGAVDGAETIELLAPQGNQNLVEVPTMPQHTQHVPDVAVQMHGYGGNNHWGAPHAAGQARGGGGGGGGWGSDRHSGMQNGYSNGSHRAQHNGYQNGGGYYSHMNGHNGQYKHH